MTPADRARIRLLGPEKCPPELQDEYNAAVLAEIKRANGAQKGE